MSNARQPLGESPPTATWARRAPVTLGGGALVLACVCVWHLVRTDPNIVFLHPEDGASWIGHDRPFNILLEKERDVRARFRRDLTVENVPPDATLTIRALKSASVLLDGHQLVQPRMSLDEWKSPIQIPLSEHLQPGRHELVVVVRNRLGPAVLLASCPALDLVTDERWEATTDGENWTPARKLTDRQPVAASHGFMPTYLALWKQAPLLLPLALVAFAVALLGPPQVLAGRLPQSLFAAGCLRWCLIAAWVVLAANNCTKVPPGLGLDFRGHAEYILRVSETWSIPFATDGWQMFQSPLYYVLSAGMHWLFEAFLEFHTLWNLLRLLPLACGIAQVELCYRAMRCIFPDRSDLQCLGTLVGGLMPMNIYMSQHIGNEPLAGFFSSLSLLLAFRCLQRPELLESGTRQCLLGAVLGCAVLSKVTPVLLLPPIVVVLVLCLRKVGASRRTIVLGVCRFGIVFLSVCGWYYARNWVELGKPFVGGWDPSRNITWWQDPGYRIIQDFTSFGESLVYPVLSARFGVWDGLYSSAFFDGYLSSAHPDFVPWNVPIILCLPLLSLAPAIAIVVGGVAALSKPRAHNGGPLLAIGCAAIYLAAILYMFLTVPVYCIAKASYALGLLPCFAVLAARGFDLLAARPTARAAIVAAMTSWAVYSYLGFFIL